MYKIISEGRLIWRFLIVIVASLMIVGCSSHKVTQRGSSGKRSTVATGKKGGKTSGNTTGKSSGDGNKTVVIPSNKRPENKEVVDNPLWSNDVELVSRIIAEARKWIGVTYRYGGVDRKGVDCSGMTQNVFADAVGVKIPRNSGAQMEFTVPLEQVHLQPGDLVFFSPSPGSNNVSHVGLYIGDRKMIHASSSRGVVESSLDERYFATHYHSSGRVKGITYVATGHKPPKTDKSPKPSDKNKSPQRKPETQPVTVSIDKLTKIVTVDNNRQPQDTVVIVEKRVIPVAALDSVVNDMDKPRPVASPASAPDVMTSGQEESIEFIESIEQDTQQVEIPSGSKVVRPVKRDNPSVVSKDSVKVKRSLPKPVAPQDTLIRSKVGNAFGRP